MSTLSDMNKENPFRTPENYFEDLPGKMMERVQNTASSEKAFLFRPSFMLPSSLVLIGMILLMVIFLKQDIYSDEEVLSDNELAQVIESRELYNIDESSIIEEYIASNIPDEAMIVEPNLKEEEITFFLEERTDLENIINEL